MASLVAAGYGSSSEDEISEDDCNRKRNDDEFDDKDESSTESEVDSDESNEELNGQTNT